MFPLPSLTHAADLKLTFSCWAVVITFSHLISIQSVFAAFAKMLLRCHMRACLWKRSELKISFSIGLTLIRSTFGESFIFVSHFAHYESVMWHLLLSQFLFKTPIWGVCCPHFQSSVKSVKRRNMFKGWKLF